MTKQSIHDFSYDDKQAALDEAYEIMQPKERLSEIEQYVNSCYKRHMSPILTQREFKLLIYLANKGLED